MTTKHGALCFLFYCLVLFEFCNNDSIQDTDTTPKDIHLMEMHVL